MKKKLLIFIIILGLVGNIALIANKPVKSQPNDYPDKYLVVQMIKMEPTPLQSSEYADIWLKVSNKGDDVIENATVRFDPRFPFSTDPDEKTEWDLGSVYPLDEYRIHFQTKVDENAVHGENNLNIYVRTEEMGEDHRKIPIQIRTDNAPLVINDVDFPENVGPGTSNTLNLTVKNLADSHLQNIDVALDLKSDTTESLNTETSQASGTSESIPFGTSDTTRRSINSMGPGDEKEISYTIHSDENAQNGVYKIPITLNYENEAGTRFSRKEMTAFVVGGQTDLEVNIAKEDLDKPGEKGKVSLNIVNRGQGNARFVSFKVPESNDYEILSPQENYLGEMGPGESKSVDLTMFPEPGLNEVKLPVEIRYKDPVEGSISEMSSVSISLYDDENLVKYDLKENPDLEIGVDQNNLKKAGGSGSLTLRIVNRGSGEAKFASIEFIDSDEYEILSADSLYLGNMLADDYQTAELQVFVEKGLDRVDIPAKISYKSPDNEVMSVSQNISVNLYSEEDLNRYGLSEDGFNILYIGIAVIAIVAVLIIWRRRG